MKKSLSIVLCVSLVIILTGCGFLFWLLTRYSLTPCYSGAGRDFSTISSTNISDSNYQLEFKQILKEDLCTSPYGKVTQEDGYNSLEDSALKTAYKDLEEAVYNISSQKNENGYYPVQRVVIKNEIIPGKLIKKTLRAFRDDHPSKFWIKNTFEFDYSGLDTVVQVYSSLSPDDCNSAIKQLETRVNTILNNIPAGLTEYERELYVHNWLIDNCEYDSEAIHLKNKLAAHNVYGAIVVGQAVCEGYSRAMQLLLNHVGIYCRLISGDAGDVGDDKNSSHMWNLVYINKAWYHLDATWNDSSQFKMYSYFNVNDDIIQLDHKIYPDFNSFTEEEICGRGGRRAVEYNINLPECFSMDANYFNVESIEVTSLGRDTDARIVNEIYNKIMEGERSISFQVSESFNYENTIAKMFTQAPYKFLFYVDSVNDMLGDKKIDKDNIMYSKDESQRAIVVQLSFV